MEWTLIYNANISSNDFLNITVISVFIIIIIVVIIIIIVVIIIFNVPMTTFL